jgi:hypothetical protein
MKKFTFLFVFMLAALVSQVNGQTVYADYESATGGTDLIFESWNGAGFEKVANPDATGVNTSDNVGKFVHTGGDWPGVGALTKIVPAVDFTTDPYFKMKVWSEHPIEVTFKLENFDAWWDPNEERKVTLTSDQTQKWVELTFNFTGVTTPNLSKIVLYFDGVKEHSLAGTEYFFDDIISTAVPPAGEMTTGPEDGATDVSLISHCTLNSNIGLQLIDNSPIDNDNVKALVSLKEGDENGTDVPFTAYINDAKDKITIDPDAMLKPNTTYWFGLADNLVEYVYHENAISGVSGTFTTTATASSLVMYEDFDGTSQTTIVEALGGDDGTLGSIVLDAMDPVSVSTVAQYNKGTTWSGWERIHIELDAPIDVTNSDIFSFNIYSPKTTYVRFKIADAKDDGAMTSFKETDADVLEANTWKNLLYEFKDLDPAVDYTHLFIFIDGGTAEETTYYVDNIQGPALATANSVFDTKKEKKLTISPNPMADILRIKDAADGEVVEIYNAAGNLVKSEQAYDGTVSVADLPRGLYFVKVDGATAKVIKK